MKKKTLIWKTAALLCIAMLVFTGCQRADKRGDNSDSQKFTIGFANINDLYPYCVKVRDYIKQFAGENGIEVLVANAAGDVKQQNDQIDNFIVQKVDMIAAISGDLDGSAPAVESSLNANIPYVSLLTHVNTEGYTYVGSENRQAGEVQGEYLAKILPENARVLYMTGQTNDQQYIDRKAGLTAKLFEVRKDITLLAEQSSDNQRDKGMSLTEDWLRSYEEFDAIIAQNDDSALGAIEALKEAKRLEDVIVIGIDGSDDALASIEAGELTMTVFQDAKAQAEAIVELAKKIRDGADTTTLENINIPFKVVTKENINEVK